MTIARRRLLAALGGAAAAWALAARAQQALPVLGFLSGQSPEGFAQLATAFRQGLKETGFVDGDNVSVDYRWAENQLDRLPALAADLVRRRVTVITASGGHTAVFAAKAATATIPIVFLAGEDPVKLGLVESLARPGGNLTGINFFSAELVAKRLELLHELMPAATRIAALVNPSNPVSEPTVRDLQTAAQVMGLQIHILNASSIREIEAAFGDLAHERPDALYVPIEPLFTARRVHLAQLAARHAIPAVYGARDYVEVGGLISYGTSLTDGYRQLGVYASRVLKGSKPSDLPVLQSSKFELVINAATARMLDLTVPPTLIARADEVIE
jgi:putative ABC transport system substrate-binding protein